MKKFITIILILLFSSSIYEIAYADWKTSIFKAGKKAWSSPPAQVGRKIGGKKLKRDYDDYKKDKAKEDLIFQIQNGKKK